MGRIRIKLPAGKLHRQPKTNLQKFCSVLYSVLHENGGQPPPVISFLGSLEYSIFYSIARYFYQEAILCCCQNAVAINLQDLSTGLHEAGEKL